MHVRPYQTRRPVVSSDRARHVRSRQISDTIRESSATVTQLGPTYRRISRPRFLMQDRFNELRVAQTHCQLVSHPHWMNGRRGWVVTVGRIHVPCGLGNLRQLLLCRSLRDVIIIVQAILMIFDCIQQRVLDILMTMKSDVVQHRFSRHVKVIRNRVVLYLRLW